MTRTDYWNRFNSRQRAIEKKFIGSVYSAVRAQYNAFLTSVKDNGYQWSKGHIHEIVTAEGIVKVLKKLYRYAAYVEGNYVLSSLIKQSGGKKSYTVSEQSDRKSVIDGGYRPVTISLKRVRSTDASFSIGLDEIADIVDQYFKIYQLNISGLPITETTKRNIEDYLIRDVEGGMPLDEAIRNFRALALTEGIPKSRSRAKLIVQTESLRAMSFGGLIGAYRSGVDVDKEWITCNDERVRGANPKYHARFRHTDLDRNRTTLFGSYYNGENIKFPGDPEASKDNTINCRCVQLYLEKKKPRPRLPQGRKLSQFLIDFFTGFFAGTQLAEAVLEGAE